MKHSSKPALLILTSSFPASPNDETSGYVRDFARSMSASFDVEVLAPPDARSSQWPSDAFKLTRSASALPRSLDRFQASSDFNELAIGGIVAKVMLIPSLLCFVFAAYKKGCRADVICSHWLIPSGLIGALLSRVLRKPHIVIEHSGALHFLLRTRLSRAVASLIGRCSEKVVVVSSDLKRKLLEIHPDAVEKIEVVPMGVASSSVYCTSAPLDSGGTQPSGSGAQRGALIQAQDQPNSATVLFVGRLVEIKGVDLLLSAMDGMQDVRLIIAGDGEKRSELERQAQRLRVRASFVGQVDAQTRDKLLAACDVVVIPSRVLDDGRSEGTPVICFEAMTAGRLVVAARTGGLADVVVDGQSGLLFEPGDQQMLREKLTLALGDESLRERIGSNARRSAKPYDWSQIGERYVEIMISVLTKHVHSLGSKSVTRPMSRTGA